MDVTFLHRFATRGNSPRMAVKDIIDMMGTITTAGCPAVAATAFPAACDAECIVHMRRAESAGTLRIVGKTNLHELAYGGDGINPHFGTPVNPLDPQRVPGGSSSGSAVAVATDQADMALGSDTGGSIRIPAACCGITGLKTTWGRIPLAGVWPLAPSLDTIGPMAPKCSGVVAAMDLLEPGFGARVAALAPATAVGRVRSPGGFVCEPGLEEAVDAALLASGIEVVDIDAPWWQPAVAHSLTVLLGEAYRTIGFLLERAHQLEPRIAARIKLGIPITNEMLALALHHREPLRAAMATTLTTLAKSSVPIQLLITPTLPIFAPVLGHAATEAPYTMYTRPANLAGTPALAMPVPVPRGVAMAEHRHLPASLQIMGPAGSEELIMATAAVIEAAVA